MADDIFLSPEEQDERARQWLKDNGMALALGIGLGLAAVVGFNKYQDHKEAQAEQASALFSTAIDEINTSDLSDIDAQVAELKEHYPNTSYAAKTVLLKARQLAVSDLPAAATELEWVVQHAPEAGLQHAARIRLAKVKLGLGDVAAAKELLKRSDYDGFESHYQELNGDVAVSEGNFAAARTSYERAIETLQSSDSGYSRVISLKLDRLPIIENTEPADVEAEDGAQ